MFFCFFKVFLQHPIVHIQISFFAFEYLIKVYIFTNVGNDIIIVDGFCNSPIVSSCTIAIIYFAGPYYAGGSFTYTKGDFSQTFNDNPWGNATSTGNGTVLYVSVAPKYRFMADIGVRFFDDRLNIGARANRIVPSEQLGLFSTVYSAKPYTTFDIYGSWDFNENASLRFAVNNLTDVAYVDPMNSSDFPAPGRTATLSLKVRF